MTAYDDAVKAAAEAGQGVSHDFLVECGLTDNEADAAINAVAEAAVAAAAPILLAAERARCARDIDQAWAEKKDSAAAADYPAYHEGYLDGLEHARRIAETAPEPCRCAGHYMACDEPCPDFWLPDVPMSPIKGHAETAPGEGP